MNIPMVEGAVAETVTQVGDNNGPYIVYSIQRTLVAYAWNPGYDQGSECKCEHSYHRHFDSYEEMYPIGCKYCECRTFSPKE